MEYMRVHVYIALVHLQWVHFVQASDWKLAIFEGVHNTYLSEEAFKIANTTQYQVLVW